MKIKLKKEKLELVDAAFSVLKEDPNNNASLDSIKKVLEESFPECKFNISIIDVDNPSKPVFVMSVFPEMAVIDKIIIALSEKKETKVIQKLWESNKVWTIEIDKRILFDPEFDFTNRELTSILLHEIGHIVCSNSIFNRLSIILQYEIAKSNLSSKMLIRDKVFRKILSLPVLDACIADNKKDRSSIKAEVKADTFAKSMGYTNELTSVLTKLMNSQSNKSKAKLDDKISQTAAYSLKTLDEFQSRKDVLSKTKMYRIKEECSSPFMKEAIDDIYNILFEDVNESLTFFDGKKTRLLQERADEIIRNGLIEEGFIDMKKKLKPIQPYDLDYIEIKMQSMKTETDKLMLVSYLHNKLDMINYYISIVENPNVASYYQVPHRLNELLEMKKRLEILDRRIIEYKLPLKERQLLVSWPKGYEG